MPHTASTIENTGARGLTVAELLALHHSHFGDARMEEGDDNADGASADSGNTAPQRPEGVAEDEWEALGDPGKRAIVRERERATAAESALAAARQATKPKPAPPKPKKPEPKAGEKPDSDAPDIAALVQQAVTEALRPMQEAQEQRDAEQAAQTIVDAVQTAAKDRLHDASDAVVALDLSTLTDGQGAPDAAKITAALDGLVQRKPHLAKVVDDRRRPAAGAPIGGGVAPAQTADDKVKASLTRMQSAAGIKLAGS